MPMKHRVSLLTALMTIVVVSMSWALPYMHRAHADTALSGPLTSVLVPQAGSSASIAQHPRRVPVTPQHCSRLGIHSDSGSLADAHRASPSDGIVPKAQHYRLGSGPEMISRRGNPPAKRIVCVGMVTDGARPRPYTGTGLRSLVAASTPMLAAVLDVPLNRGPTSSIR